MKIFYIKTMLIYRILFFLHPLEVAKKILKILKVSKAIILNQVTYYPNFVIKFEEKFAKIVGAKYGLSFSNGTGAIEAALFAININHGDKVAVPSCIFHSDIDAIKNFGAKPIFVDVSRDNSLNVPIEEYERGIKEGAKCIIVFHSFGYVSDIAKIARLAKEKNIYLIEDCSHSHGAKFQNQMVGTFGDIGCYSLQGAKAVAAGEGGIAVTNSQHLYARMSLYGHFSRHYELFSEADSIYSDTGGGRKLRAHPLGIALATVDLKFLEIYNLLMKKNEVKIKNLLIKNNISIIEPIYDSENGGFFSGVPFIVKKKNISQVDIINIFASYGINIKPYPYKRHHIFKIYSQDNMQSMPFTEMLEKTVFFLDRRLLIFFPFYVKVALNKALNKLNEIS